MGTEHRVVVKNVVVKNVNVGKPRRGACLALREAARCCCEDEAGRATSRRSPHPLFKPVWGQRGGFLPQLFTLVFLIDFTECL